MTTPDASGNPPVQIKEDPDSLSIREKIAAAETKQADSTVAMATAAGQMADLLKPLPVTDAELWRGFLHVSAAGVLRHPSFEPPIPRAASMADAMLTEYRKRYS